MTGITTLRDNLTKTQENDHLTIHDGIDSQFYIDRGGLNIGYGFNITKNNKTFVQSMLQSAGFSQATREAVASGSVISFQIFLSLLVVISLTACSPYNAVRPYDPKQNFTAQNEDGLVIVGIDTTNLSNRKYAPIVIDKFSSTSSQTEISCKEWDQASAGQPRGMSAQFHAFLVPSGTYLLSENGLCFAYPICGYSFSIEKGTAVYLGTVQHIDDKKVIITSAPSSAELADKFPLINVSIVPAKLSDYREIPNTAMCTP